MAVGVVVVDCCELCALRPREHACLVAAWSMAGWLACSRATQLDRKRVLVSSILHSHPTLLLPPDTNITQHQHHSTPTPYQAVLNRRHVWWPTILVSTFFFTPSFSPSTLRDDILEFCNANGFSLLLSGGGYETICG